ncbi:MAG: serine hydrolase [Myxococcota bacterium]
MLSSLLLLPLVLALPERDPSGLPHLRSESVLIRNVETGEILLSRRPDLVRPIASVTKLMTALVFSERVPKPDQPITLEECDKDRLKWSKSRLKIGKTYAAADLFSAALGASDNRAVYALVRGAGVERGSFVDEMNSTAEALGMDSTHFQDPAGIDPSNVSTATDLLKLLDAVASEEWVQKICLGATFDLTDEAGHVLTLGNPDRLARSKDWDLVIGKTGYISESGRNLVLRVRIEGRTIDMVFLGSREMASVFGDAGRVKRWLLERFQRGSIVNKTATATGTPSKA